MSKRRVQATIPEPYETVSSLRATAMATKELVEVLAGQRGDHEDWAVTHGEMPVIPRGDQLWNPFAYSNGWADYAPPFSPCGYRKLATGLVILRGLTLNGTGALICTLPPRYRPGIQMLFIAETAPNASCRLDLSPAGELTHTGGNSGWISLNNICFLAEN